jgi:DNA-binding LacI/PurR family transcriptional regulator
METTLRKKIRLLDVARECQVSLPTASMALANHPEINHETCKRVQMVSKKLGYQRPGERTYGLKQKESLQKSLRFGFLLIGTRLSDEVMTSTLHAMSMQASELKVRLELRALEDVNNSMLTKEQVLEFIRELDGIILEGLIDTNLLSLIENTHLPYVVLGNIISQSGEIPPTIGHFITYNVQAMGQLATARLLACGHRRIGFFTEQTFRGLWNSQWMLGYLSAQWEIGSVPDPAMIHVAGKPRIGGVPAAEYFTALKEPPTAYISPDVRTAASFINQMAKWGHFIPDDAMILGGLPDIASKYHLENHPLIGVESESLGKVTLDFLYQLYKDPALTPRTIQLPFITRNLPLPTTKPE